MEVNRREFIVAPAAAMAGSLFAANAEIGWQRKIRRIGQLQQPVLDLDIIMGARQGQSRGGLERTPASLVQPPHQRLQINRGHSTASPILAALGRPPRSSPEGKRGANGKANLP